MAHLDQRKDEAIERTFKQVSREFATIFERLVPAGHGRLVIQRRTDRRVDPDESDEEQRSSVENYTGVGISVSFNSKVLDEQQRIQQLSGGQKSESWSREMLRLFCNILLTRAWYRFVCLVSHLCAASDRVQSHGHFRRGGRQSRRSVPHSRCGTARVNLARSRHAVHLHHFPTRDCSCRRPVLRCAIPKQKQYHQLCEHGGGA